MRKKKSSQFGERDFVKAVWKTMADQEKENPLLALLHERLRGGMRLVGLTGGIATGKSTAAAFFRDEGVPVIDADEIAHEVARPSRPAYRKIVKEFGKGIVGARRQLDRRALGRIVFANPIKRKKLEAITHPEILREMARQIKTFRRRKKKIVVIEAPLLFEAGLAAQMDKNIVVRIDTELQIRRLMERDRLTREEVLERLRCQMPLMEKEKKADFLIDNSSPPEETRRQVREILHSLSIASGVVPD